MENRQYYKLQWIFLILICFLLSSGCTASNAPNIARGWSYEVRAGQEKSSREYLLVRGADTNEEKRFAVRSECIKPHPAEGTYGECKHIINVIPSGQTLTLSTGEDVVLVQYTWGFPTIFATIEYGCCAGPDVARFYAEQGEYLGRVEGIRMGERANYGNVIARTFDMNNGTRYGERIYLLTLPESATDSYHLQVFDGKHKISQLPVDLQVAESDHCEAWYIDKFTAYGDRKDILLELQGSFCTAEKDRITFSCLPTEVSMKCVLFSR